MSRTASFMCLDCKVQLRLGKAIYSDGAHVRYFKIGPPEAPQNAERPELTRSLWKMLAEHAGHELRVGVEEDAEHGAAYYERAVEEGFCEIGPAILDDDHISFEDYLKDWPG